MSPGFVDQEFWQISGISDPVGLQSRSPVVCWQMADPEEGKQLHSHAQCLGGVAGRCTQLECPPDHLHLHLRSQTDCMAADSTHGDHSRNEEEKGSGS